MFDRQQFDMEIVDTVEILLSRIVFVSLQKYYSAAAINSADF